MPKPTTTRAPEGAGTAGKRLWRAITGGFELDEHELVLLRQAVRVTDLCEQLQGLVDAEGVVVANRFGEARANPALVELRAQRLLLARLLVALRVPLGEADDQPERTQVRALRGVYGVGIRGEAS